MSRKLTRLKIQKLLAKLKKFGVEVMPNDRGKGSEIILQRPTEDGSKKGPQYTLKNHGKNTELGVGTIKALLRRFDIDRSEFLTA